MKSDAAAIYSESRICFVILATALVACRRIHMAAFEVLDQPSALVQSLFMVLISTGCQCLDLCCIGCECEPNTLPSLLLSIEIDC